MNVCIYGKWQCALLGFSFFTQLLKIFRVDYMLFAYSMSSFITLTLFWSLPRVIPLAKQVGIWSVDPDWFCAGENETEFQNCVNILGTCSSSVARFLDSGAENVFSFCFLLGYRTECLCWERDSLPWQNSVIRWERQTETRRGSLHTVLRSPSLHLGQEQTGSNFVFKWFWHFCFFWKCFVSFLSFLFI